MSRRHSNAMRAHFKATDVSVYVSVCRAAKIIGVDQRMLNAYLKRNPWPSGQVTEHVAGRLVVKRSHISELAAVFA